MCSNAFTIVGAVMSKLLLLKFECFHRFGVERLPCDESSNSCCNIEKTEPVLISVQNELDYCGEEPPMSPRAPVQQQQHSQPAMHVTNPSFPVSSGSSLLTTSGQGIRSEHCDHQSKNSVFSNALSSPLRQSLQHYHITRGGFSPNSGLPMGNGARNNEPTFPHNQSRDSSALSSNDSAMDMHADSPAHESIY